MKRNMKDAVFRSNFKIPVWSH